MRFRCNQCADFPASFEFEDNGGVCPRCNASKPPFVAALIDVHLLVLDGKGPIQGSAGRQFVACEPARDHLGRSIHEPYSATGEPRAVTCPRCKRTQEFRDRARLFAELLPLLEATPTLTVDMKAGQPGG